MESQRTRIFRRLCCDVLRTCAHRETVELLDPTMQIFVKNIAGKSVTLDVEPSDSILRVKQKVQVRERIPVKDQHLVFGGRDLSNGKSLGGYNIGQESTLHLVLQVVGGMPKKGKGKKAKGKGGGDDGAEITPERKVQMLEAEKIALTRELGHFKQQARKAVSEKKELEEGINGLKDELSTAEDVKLQIVKDMTRQYKSMQENLLNQVNEAHDTIAKLKQDLAASGQSMNQSQRDFQHIIEQKDATIRDQNRKMEDMANEFAEMLKETLEKMRQRIEVSSVTWESDKGGSRAAGAP